MKKLITLLTIGTAAIGIQSASAALVLTPTTSGSTLVSNLTGAGVSTSNISLVGASGQAGTFSGGIASGIGFDSGIILSTGKVLDASNPAVGPGVGIISWSYQVGGDADLTLLSGQNTYDASVLSFNFESTSSSLFFRFVFGSEEYPDYVGEMNDAFAIFLDGQNIATLPGTSIPVTINNVNSGANSAYYKDNTSGTYLNAYNGFTTPIQVSISGLTPGTHTMNFAIADAGDDSYDSAVFIDAGSFSATLDSVGSAAVPEPGQVAASLLLLGGIGGYFFVKRRKAAKATLVPVTA
jgi:hypothetical protein